MNDHNKPAQAALAKVFRVLDQNFTNDAPWRCAACGTPIRRPGANEPCKCPEWKEDQTQ